MANSKFDAKSFNPEAFKYMVGRVPNLTLNALKKSRALAGNPDIRAVFTSQNGTGYARLAMRGLLDGDAVNYDGETDITATSTKTFEQGMVVVGRAKAWTEKDFSYDITGGVDFMGNVSAQVAEYKDTLDQKTLLSILKGVFAMPTTDAKNKEFVEKHSTTIYAPMSATTLNSAVNKACGANMKWPVTPRPTAVLIPCICVSARCSAPMRCEISRNMKGSWRVNSLNLIRRGTMLMIF